MAWADPVTGQTRDVKVILIRCFVVIEIKKEKKRDDK
jgi:hypothetical protein